MEGYGSQFGKIEFLSYSIMDTFDNFQSDYASSYGGGIGVVDDNSSVYTSNTHDDAASSVSVDLSSLSVSDSFNSAEGANGHGHNHLVRGSVSEDFDAVLDELTDEGALDLPPHACR